MPHVNRNGAILWEGASRIDGSPIVAIITGLTRDSANGKTGAMAQVFILRSDISPLSAIKTGQDHAICGKCKHRGVAYGPMGQAMYSDRSCYVVVAQSPQSVFRAFERGVYQRRTAEEVSRQLAGRTVRLGAYGDPAAVPVNVWRELTKHTKSHTGYTHQWADGTADEYRGLIMASVDTPEEYQQARLAGWRTFRVRTAGQDLTPAEITCPASEEAGYRTTCAKCGLCAGAEKMAKSIAILAHGNGAASFVSLQSLRRAS